MLQPNTSSNVPRTLPANAQHARYRRATLLPQSRYPATRRHAHARYETNEKRALFRAFAQTFRTQPTAAAETPVTS